MVVLSKYRARAGAGIDTVVGVGSGVFVGNGAGMTGGSDVKAGTTIGAGVAEEQETKKKRKRAETILNGVMVLFCMGCILTKKRNGINDSFSSTQK
jgi:serine acetyltransferase